MNIKSSIVPLIWMPDDLRIRRLYIILSEDINMPPAPMAAALMPGLILDWGLVNEWYARLWSFPNWGRYRLYGRLRLPGQKGRYISLYKLEFIAFNIFI